MARTAKTAPTLVSTPQAPATSTEEEDPTEEDPGEEQEEEIENAGAKTTQATQGSNHAPTGRTRASGIRRVSSGMQEIIEESKIFRNLLGQWRELSKEKPNELIAMLPEIEDIIASAENVSKLSESLEKKGWTAPKIKRKKAQAFSVDDLVKVKSSAASKYGVKETDTFKVSSDEGISKKTIWIVSQSGAKHLMPIADLIEA